MKNKPNRKKPMEKLAHLIAVSEDRLMKILHGYTIGRGYSKYTSTLEEAWRMSVSVLSATMVSACESLEGPPELGPDMDYQNDPIASFGILEAQKHRERGISIEMFMGLLKYYKQSYIDLVKEADFEKEYEDKCRLFVDRFYDRIELGLCKEWITLDNDQLIEKLQVKNRIMTNEKNKYLTIFESLPHPVIFINNDLKIENMNNAAMQFLHGINVPGSQYYRVSPDGNNHEPCIDHLKVADFLPWLVDDIQSFTHHSDPTVRFERKMQGNKALQYFDVSMSRMLDISQKFSGMVVVLTDITERKQSEKALRESELLWRLSIDNMLEAYALHEAIFDETGRMVDYRFLEFNPAAQKISNIARKEIIGKTALELYPHIVERGLLDRYADVMATGVPAIINDFYYTGDKLDKAFDISCFRIDDQHFVCLFRDITDRKQAEAEKEKLEAQNRQLQKAESLGRMAGAIAHHFNNQLGTVIGNLELAMNKLSGSSGPDETLAEAMKSAFKAAEMSGLMLTYLGQTHDEQDILDLSETCNSSLHMLRAAMPKDVVLKTDLSSPGPTVRANENQIQQVLINLVNNAWEGMGDSRGAINITIKTVSPGDIPVMHRFPIDWKPQENDYACLEVADAGCGIEDNDIEKLFDPFYSSKFTGRGLGLAVVLGILRSHRGAVTVESEPGKGSIFRVFLPVSAEEVSRHPEEAAEAPKQEEGGTILLVEDEQAMRKMAMTMLTFMGYTVLEAADGAEAVGIFQQHKDEIRCVLCDLTMPRMDGWETLAALRKLSPDIPFILASGYDKAKVMSGDHAEWPQAFLGKPYMLNGLSDAIRLAIAKRSGKLVARGRERRKS